MLTTFNYPQFRADFVALKRNPWWKQKAIWKDYYDDETIWRPTENAVFKSIARQCGVYTPEEQQEAVAVAQSEALYEVRTDMQQEYLLRDRIKRRQMPLKERLAERGMTLMWQHLDTPKRNVVEVLLTP